MGWIDIDRVRVRAKGLSTFRGHVGLFLQCRVRVRAKGLTTLRGHVGLFSAIWVKVRAKGLSTFCGHVGLFLGWIDIDGIGLGFRAKGLSTFRGHVGLFCNVGIDLTSANFLIGTNYSGLMMNYLDWMHAYLSSCSVSISPYC